MVEVFEGGKEFEGNMRLRKSGSSSKLEYMKSLPAESNPGRGGALPYVPIWGCAAGQGMAFNISLLIRIYNFMGCPKQCSIITRRK